MGKKTKYFVFFPMDVMGKLLVLWQKLTAIVTMNSPSNLIAATFYTSPAMMLFNSIFLVVLFKRKRSLPYYSLFKIYGLLTLLDDILGFLNASDFVLYLMTIIVTFVELTVFYSYFIFTSSDNKLKKKLFEARKIFTISSLLVLPGFVWFVPELYTGIISGYYVVVCNLINLVPAFIYMGNILIQPSSSGLSRRSSFWITMGILVLNSVDIPLFLTNYYLYYHTIEAQKYFLAAGYIAYCFLFACLTVAFLYLENQDKRIPDEHIETSPIASK